MWCTSLLPQSVWCNWFAGRCSRRTFQTRVTSCLTSGCQSGPMQRIHQHGSSAIMQLTKNSNTMKTGDVQISNFRLLTDFHVFGVVVWSNGPVIREIKMNISMACHCIISWGSSVHLEMFSLWTSSYFFSHVYVACQWGFSTLSSNWNCELSLFPRHGCLLCLNSHSMSPRCFLVPT